jgi:hypothetical protein
LFEERRATYLQSGAEEGQAIGRQREGRMLEPRRWCEQSSPDTPCPDRFESRVAHVTGLVAVQVVELVIADLASEEVKAARERGGRGKPLGPESGELAPVEGRTDPPVVGVDVPVLFEDGETAVRARDLEDPSERVSVVRLIASQ